jgi:hypothetical protein
MEGKEVLIKSVLQAVPTYPMGCFKLSQKMCSKLTSIATGFWWGSVDLHGNPLLLYYWYLYSHYYLLDALPPPSQFSVFWVNFVVHPH